MNTNASFNRLLQIEKNKRRHPYAQQRLDAAAAAILREMAFILKMSERVRASIEADRETHEPMLA